MTTTAHADPHTSSSQPGPPRPDGGGRSPLLRYLAGGFLIGAGLGLALELGTWPLPSSLDLDWSLVAAGGLLLVGAGFLTRPPRRGGATAAVSAVALVFGAAALAASATGGTAEVVEDVRGWTAEEWSAMSAGAGEVEDDVRDNAVGADVGRVRVDLDRGRLEIVEGADPGLSFATRGGGRLDHREDGGLLTVTGRCPDRWLWFPDPRCRTDVALTVPAGADVTVDHGAGDVAVTGTTGSTSLEVGAADVTLSSVAGALELRTGAGDVEGTRLSSRTAVVESGAGDLDLAFLDPPRDVEIATGAGDVRVRVPGGAYATDVETGSGSSEVTGILSDPSAPSRLTVDTGAGDVVITARAGT